MSHSLERSGSAVFSAVNRATASNATDEPWLSGAYVIGPEHPALAGHFPGNPVVPGVIVLQRVFALLESSLPEPMAVSVIEAKFLRPLRPAETCTIAIQQAGERKLTFDCRMQREIVARGTLVLDAPG